MSKKVNDLLNQARSRELTAISQYMAQHYELEDQDFGKLASRLKEIAIQEMLATDMALEAQAIKMYNDASVVCAAEKDQISKELFEELLKDEEEHLDNFENIKDHVDKLGAAYLATLTGK